MRIVADVAIPLANPRLPPEPSELHQCLMSLLVRLWHGGAHIRVGPQHLKIELHTMLALIRLSASGMFQTLVGMASWLALIRIISGFGSAALAGYTIAIRLVIFALLPSFGLANAAATMVGQNLGAGKPERAEQAVWTAGLYNMVFLGVIGALFVLFAELIIRAFTQDVQVVPYGVRCLRTVSLGFLFYAYAMVLGQAFNGAGDVWTATLINLFCFWFWELPLGYVLVYWFNWGPSGVFAAITIAFSTYAVVSAVIFKRGRWKLKKI